MTDPDWSEALRLDDRYELRAGVSPAELTEAESILEAVFPRDLRTLYLLTNGVYDLTGQWFVIWPLEDVVARNRQSWQWEGRPREKFIGFGDDGTGDPFCVPRDGAGGVFHWSPIESVATWLANNVTGFWSGWTAGTIKT